MVLKKALITGITGQDGSYLAEYLLKKGYVVHGLIRRSSQPNTNLIRHLNSYNQSDDVRLHLHYGDLADAQNITRIVSDVAPDEIYNLAAQSHVAVSFDAAEYTSDVNALGALRLLEAVRILGLKDQTRYYQASTSELFGQVRSSPQNELTPFYPRSPYAVAKLYAYWATVNYREAYDLFACNGILFNHESPRRGEAFVTRKITMGLSNIAYGLDDCLYMGNVDAKRDWGHALDYVAAQWLMLQHESPDDFVIATGEQHTVRDFITWAAEDIGVTLEFSGNGLEEVAMVSSIVGDNAPALRVGDVVMRIDPKFFRPSEVGTLLGDPTKAKTVLGWQPRFSARQLCSEMVREDMKIASQRAQSQMY